MNFTTVCGLDRRHLEQLSLVWPTWKKNKPDILKNPMLVFYDYEQVSHEQVQEVLDHPNLEIRYWPRWKIFYGIGDGSKWAEPQRVKMLTGFVYISGLFVKTKYWLKLDTDVIARDQPDWINPDWFKNDPAIVCPPWGFTRPPEQMLFMDDWVEQNKNRFPFQEIAGKPPLDLHPDQGEDRVKHKRICSWCGFFKSSLSRTCFQLAQAGCGPGFLPINSQDGYMWYVAKRLGLGIERVRMKNLGWETWSNRGNLVKNTMEIMNA